MLDPITPTTTVLLQQSDDAHETNLDRTKILLIQVQFLEGGGRKVIN